MTRTLAAVYDGKAFLPEETGTEPKSAEYSFLRVAQSLNLEGPPDWSERIEDYLERD